MPNIKKAVALAYDKNHDAVPKVLAKAKGVLAQQIIDKARECDINIFSNPMLIDALMKLELDEEIPIALYQSVAELFAWLAQIEAKTA